MDKINYHILAEPWAITKEALESVCHELKTTAPAAGLFDSANKVNISIDNHIAIIPVQYSLYRFSYDRIRSQVDAALHDSSVRAIVLKINSPGGLVSGCKELADFICTAGKQKHIYAYADGTMTSAAYWLGSAARDIAAPVTANIGSIGVRTIHIDWSKWNENAGLDFTHLAAGEYKALGNEDEPLNKKARDYFQAQLDTLYSIFVDSVAGNLGVDTKKALSMADGRVFLAEEALEKGMINRITQDFESYFSYILKKEKIMDLTTLKADHPALYSQALEEGKKAAAAENEQKIKDAVAEEAQRVLGIAGAVIGEDTAGTLKKVVESGASVEVVTAMKDTFKPAAAEDADDTTATTTRGQILDGLEQAHSEGVGQMTGKAKPGQESLDDQASSFSDLVND